MPSIAKPIMALRALIEQLTCVDPCTKVSLQCYGRFWTSVQDPLLEGALNTLRGSPVAPLLEVSAALETAARELDMPEHAGLRAEDATMLHRLWVVQDHRGFARRFLGLDTKVLSPEQRRRLLQELEELKAALQALESPEKPEDNPQDEPGEGGQGDPTQAAGFLQALDDAASGPKDDGPPAPDSAAPGEAGESAQLAATAAPEPAPDSTGPAAPGTPGESPTEPTAAPGESGESLQLAAPPVPDEQGESLQLAAAAPPEPAETKGQKKKKQTGGVGTFQSFVALAQREPPVSEYVESARWAAARAHWHCQQGDGEKCLKALNSALKAAGAEAVEKPPSSLGGLQTALQECLPQAGRQRPGCPRCRYNKNGCPPSCRAKREAEQRKRELRAATFAVLKKARTDEELDLAAPPQRAVGA